MSNTFLMNLSAESNKGLTENKGIGYNSSLDPLIDYFIICGGSYDPDNVEELFEKALNTDPLTTIRLMFYLRDVRGGQGIRNSFRKTLVYLANTDLPLLKQVLMYVPVYGRWDDILCLLDTPAKDYVLETIAYQLENDISNFKDQKPISLLAKWLPSENASSKTTRRYGRIIREYLGYTPREYRKILTHLRKYLRVVEQLMSTNQWDKIEFENVPSLAMLRYRNAFYRHTPEKFQQYIEQVKSGEKKLNFSVGYPHQVIDQIINDINKAIAENMDDEQRELFGVLVFDDLSIMDDDCSTIFPDQAKRQKITKNIVKKLLNEFDKDFYQQLWENLTKTSSDNNAIAVIDTSGSMFCGSPTPISVSVALGLYFAERAKGCFANKIITFSEYPQLIDCSGDNIVDRLYNLMTNSSWGMNTNIERVFDMILNAALNSNKDDIPKRVYIISDMQFDRCCGIRNTWKTVFETIKEKYEDAGVELPQLVFWNVNTSYALRNASFQTTVIDGTNWINISGFNPVILDYLMKTDLDTINDKDITLRVIETIVNSPRYAEAIHIQYAS